MVIDCYICTAGSPVGCSRPATQWKLGGEFEALPGREVLRFAWEIIIKASPLDLVVEVVAVKELSSTAHVVFVSLEELRQKNRVIQNWVMNQRTFVDVIREALLDE